MTTERRKRYLSAAQQRYTHTPKGRAVLRRYQRSAKFKLVTARYTAKQEFIDWNNARNRATYLRRSLENYQLKLSNPFALL